MEVTVKTMFALLVALVLLNSGETKAQQEPLLVGTKETAPFSFKNEQGDWTGISIELWRKIAEDLGLEYEFREMDLEALLAGVENGSLDAAVAAFTITAEREARLDFTHPYFTTGLSIAIAHDSKAGWTTYLERMFSPDLLKVIFLLAFLLLLVGLGIWLFERKHNPEQFGGSTLDGITSGFWWSAVTMTTVGYGDKAPTSLGGRIIGLIWMFAGIIMISSFTAAITSELTISHLEAKVRGPEDLRNVRVVTVAGSTSEAFLRSQHIAFVSYKTAQECLASVSNGASDAAVYDAPILRYMVTTDLREKIRVLPNSFKPQYYGIALPQNSRLREKINRVLLKNISLPRWGDVLYRYLGS